MSYNARFKKLYPYVLRVEGGYVWDRNDKGGATKYGIAFNYNQGYLKTLGITSPAQMKDLTLENALEIYYKKYWVPSRADEIPDDKLALVYFDHVINAGQGAADNLLKKLDPKLFNYEGQGANTDYWWEQTTKYLLERLYFYTQLGQWNTYGLGWTNRLRHIADAIRLV